VALYVPRQGPLETHCAWIWSSQNANVGPVFIMYKNRTDLSEIVEEIISGEPEVSFVAVDGIQHIVWPVTDEGKVARIRQAFEGYGESQPRWQALALT
jgi:uncharacterized protein (DUF1015 family)